MSGTPTHLITGFPGAGKTSLLRTLLAFRPPQEHWALLLNGSSNVASADGITVHSIGNVCACCTGRASFRTAMVRLLRTARPQRLLIELAGTGDPAGVKVVLNEETMLRAVTLASTICVVQPRHLANADIAQHEIYTAQLQHADHVVLAEDDSTAREKLADLSAQVTLANNATLALLSPVVNARAA